MTRSRPDQALDAKELYARFVALPAAGRRRVLIELCGRALEVWEERYPVGSQINYFETVAGTSQSVDVGLPREALCVLKGEGVDANIAERYLEPMVALRDRDLELPDPVEFAYYCIYNAY